MFFGYGKVEPDMVGFEDDLFVVAKYSNGEPMIAHLAEAHPETIYFQAEVVTS